MTARQFWISTSVSTVICVAIVAAVLKALRSPSPAPSPSPPIPAPAPVPCPTPDVPAAGIAQQRARLKLSDGRTATFQFALVAPGIPGRGTLSCTAAVGLDQVLCVRSCAGGGSLAARPRPGPDAAGAPDTVAADADADAAHSPAPQSSAAGPFAAAEQPAGVVPLRSLDADRHAAGKAGHSGVARVAVLPRQTLSVGKRLRVRHVPLDGKQNAVVPLPAGECRCLEALARLAANLSRDGRQDAALDAGHQ